MRIRPILLASLTLLACTLPACSSTSGSSNSTTTAPETNTITGDVSTTASVSLDSAYAAANAAIAELQFTPIRQTRDALTGNVSAKTADNKTVDIKLTKKSDAITEINVNAGILERSLSQTVMETLRRKID
ncbi:MAG: DUF3568 family protein [Phycisphaerales bacterium]|nr:DUF3568 family protein [Phycisphaerales bacterium]